MEKGSFDKDIYLKHNLQCKMSEKNQDKEDPNMYVRTIGELKPSESSFVKSVRDLSQFVQPVLQSRLWMGISTIL